MKEENKKIIIRRWLKRAQEDELNIISILKHRDGTPGIVCFLSQQMAEKCLKTLLIFFDIELEKTHDLQKLTFLLKDHTLEIKNINKETTLLNRFYIETRYVGDFPEFLWSDAEKAYEAVKKVKELVLNKILK